MKLSVILAIESSCDETAVALLQEPQELLVSLVSSQVEEHAPFGGVVPEVASRRHGELVGALVKQALDQTQLTFSQITAVAATTGPGLAPALLVGSSYAKGIALAAGIPYLGINHLEGHLLSPFLEVQDVPSHLGVLISGGHTAFYDVPCVGEYHLMGKTLDDAVGEAFDKVAKLLGLPYPGGKIIDELAAKGDPHRYPFPKALLEKGNLNMSLSGIKTAVRYFLDKKRAEQSAISSESFSHWLSEELPHIAASFQEAVFSVLEQKIIWAMEQRGRKQLAISGGVACNQRLQKDLMALAEKKGWKLWVPPPTLVTDNAAMIALAAMKRWQQGSRTSLDEEVKPRWEIG